MASVWAICRWKVQNIRLAHAPVQIGGISVSDNQFIFSYSPANEQGVVLLFCKIAQDLNPYAEEIKPGFPHCGHPALVLIRVLPPTHFAPPVPLINTS
ncbi:MAG: hypothetical protein ABSA45_04450 [Verrucomicrobiota bacterium]